MLLTGTNATKANNSTSAGNGHLMTFGEIMVSVLGQAEAKVRAVITVLDASTTASMKTPLFLRRG
jgi:hypothetical protein